MKSKYRLSSSSPFERKEEEKRVEPKRIIFLSVEGEVTEKDYFSHLDKKLEDTKIQINVLDQQGIHGYSDAQNVINLLQDCMKIRKDNIIPEDVKHELVSKYSEEELERYCNNPESISEEKAKEINEELKLFGVNMAYRRQLSVGGDKDKDFFAVIIDRDSGSNTREFLEKCKKQCDEKNINFFISNPCFEFWLLLHLCDIKKEYTEKELEEIYENKRISNKHTVISKIISERTHKNKKISLNFFEEVYWPNIAKAVKQSEEFSTSYPELLDNLGTNLSDLIRTIGEDIGNDK